MGAGEVHISREQQATLHSLHGLQTQTTNQMTSSLHHRNYITTTSLLIIHDYNEFVNHQRVLFFDVIEFREKVCAFVHEDFDCLHHQ